MDKVLHTVLLIHKELCLPLVTAFFLFFLFFFPGSFHDPLFDAVSNGAVRCGEGQKRVMCKCKNISMTKKQSPSVWLKNVSKHLNPATWTRKQQNVELEWKMNGHNTSISDAFTRFVATKIDGFTNQQHPSSTFLSLLLPKYNPLTWIQRVWSVTLCTWHSSGPCWRLRSRIIIRRKILNVLWAVFKLTCISNIIVATSTVEHELIIFCRCFIQYLSGAFSL